MVSVRDEAIEAAAKVIHGGLFPEMRHKGDWPALTDEQRSRYRQVAAIALDAEHAAMLERGWKMTPREPTEEMLDAGYSTTLSADTIWPAAWDAAPSPGDES